MKQIQAAIVSFVVILIVGFLLYLLGTSINLTGKEALEPVVDEISVTSSVLPIEPGKTRLAGGVSLKVPSDWEETAELPSLGLFDSSRILDSVRLSGRVGVSIDVVVLGKLSTSDKALISNCDSFNAVVCQSVSLGNTVFNQIRLNETDETTIYLSQSSSQVVVLVVTDLFPHSGEVVGIIDSIEIDG